MSALVNHSRKWLRGPQEAEEVECRPALWSMFCWCINALGLTEQSAAPWGPGGLRTVETEALPEPGAAGPKARVPGLAPPGGSEGEPVPALSPASGSPASILGGPWRITVWLRSLLRSQWPPPMCLPLCCLPGDPILGHGAHLPARQCRLHILTLITPAKTLFLRKATFTGARIRA